MVQKCVCVIHQLHHHNHEIPRILYILLQHQFSVFGSRIYFGINTLTVALQTLRTIRQTDVSEMPNWLQPFCTPLHTIRHTDASEMPNWFATIPYSTREAKNQRQTATCCSSEIAAHSTVFLFLTAGRSFKYNESKVTFLNQKCLYQSLFLKLLLTMNYQKWEFRYFIHTHLSTQKKHMWCSITRRPWLASHNCASSVGSKFFDYGQLVMEVGCYHVLFFFSAGTITVTPKIPPFLLNTEGKGMVLRVVITYYNYEDYCRQVVDH